MLLHNYFPSWPQNGLHLWFLAMIRTKHCAAYHRLQFFNHSLSCRSEVGPLVTWGAGTWWTDRTDSLTVLVRLLHQNSAFTDISNRISTEYDKQQHLGCCLRARREQHHPWILFLVERKRTCANREGCFTYPEIFSRYTWCTVSLHCCNAWRIYQQQALLLVCLNSFAQRALLCLENSHKDTNREIGHRTHLSS